MLFKILPMSALGVGPEISNNMEAPHNCVGGSEVQCIPQNCGPLCYNPNGLTAPAHWYAKHDTAPFAQIY
eukprot:748797-Rhodomonas_salina.1